MNVNVSVAFFAVATLLQLIHCKPTHRFVRENVDEVESRTNKFKEFLSHVQGYAGSSGGSTPQSQSPSSATYETDLISTQIETSAGPEAADSKVHPSIVARDGSTLSNGLPSYTNYNMPSELSQYPSQLPQSTNPSQYFNSN